MSFSAPVNQPTLHPIYPPYQDHPDRDSTISASEDDTHGSEDDIPASQASQAASNMLRRQTSRSSNMPVQRIAATASSSHLIQSKLLGRVAKRGVPFDSTDKAWSSDRVNNQKFSKKVRLDESRAERVGLGIDMWSSTKR